ncbi:cell division protein ZapA [Hyphomicrobium sp.]|uniref:cell division protein ZapA n=1 Tax=Hyphomicrobium sp. TaxID=82 RepID=UPI000FB6A6CB|nr:cell division protein ZapA [Hyphomicrobium sp.]RUO99437.1 MAG: cell division protein ZapA [Hyphomicrobium sp.]
MAEVPFTFNQRTYRFQCDEHDARRLKEIVAYFKSKLDDLLREHGSVGDERLILMAALMITDELFDARADVDDLLEGSTAELRTVAIRSLEADDAEPTLRRAKA